MVAFYWGGVRVIFTGIENEKCQFDLLEGIVMLLSYIIPTILRYGKGQKGAL